VLEDADRQTQTRKDGIGQDRAGQGRAGHGTKEEKKKRRKEDVRYLPDGFNFR